MDRKHRLLLGSVFLAASCLGTGILPAQQTRPRTSDDGLRRGTGTVTFSVRDQYLRTVMEYIADRAHVNIVVDDDIDARISLELRDVQWRQAMDLAAEKAGCIVLQKATNLFKVEKPPQVHFAFDDADISEVINTIAKLSGANIMFDSEVQGTITVRLKDIPWRDALEVAAKQLGFVVVEEDRGILRVVHQTKLKAELETRSFQLRYLAPKSLYTPALTSQIIRGGPQPIQGRGAGGGGGQGGTMDVAAANFEVLQAIQETLSPAGEIKYIASRNVLIVKDTRIVLDDIEKMLLEVDQEPRQVFVDVKFVSTVNTDVFDFGVDYGAEGPSVTMSMGAIPHSLPFVLGDGGFEDSIIVTNPGNGGYQQPDPQGGGSGPFPGGASPGPIPQAQYGILDFTGVIATLRLLQSDTKAKIVQAPRIIALDRQSATIFVGEEIRYAEAKTEQGQAGGLSLTVEEAENSPVNTGFQLIITPQIVPNTEKILLDVIPKQEALSGSNSVPGAPAGFDVFEVGANGAEGRIALPRLQKAELMTRLMLHSGTTAVIGGLTTDSESETVRKVPYLGDIPVLGWLFKSTSHTKDRRSLIVMITPHIVASPEDTADWLTREIETRRRDHEREFAEIMGFPTDSADSFMGTAPAENQDANPSPLN